MISESATGNVNSSLTSLTLLERMKVREPEGWGRFCRIYGPLVYGWARRVGLQSHDASDVVQEVFLVVSGRIAGFQRLQDRNFRNWLWTISRHVIQAHFRKLGDRPVASGGTSANIRLAEVAEIDSLADPVSELDERSGIILRALQTLRSEVQDITWQAFWRTTVGGEAASIVAVDLGLTNWAVYKIKARLLLRVRQELDGLVPWQELLNLSDSETLPRNPQ